ncbi:MAG: tetratricopeptide repeat protein, partial [Myxococcota bacterium]
MDRRRLPLILALVAMLVAVGPLGCQKSFDDRLAEARELQEQGDFAASIDRLRELASEQPDNGEVSYRLGVALANTGETSASFWPLRKAAESPAHAVDAGLLLSRLLQQTGNHAEAIVAAEGVLKADSESGEGLIYLSRAQILAKQLEEGLASAERALELDEANTRAYWLRASALAELERPEESADAYAQMREVASEAGEISLVTQACAAEAEQRAANLDQAEAASKLLEECIEDQPGSVALVRAAAQLRVENEEPELAEAVWREAIEAAPDALELRKGLAQHLAAQERWDEAIATLSEAVEDFGTIEASAALAELHVDHDDNPAAEAVLSEAAERLGDSDPLRFQRAELMLEEGDLDAAEALAGTIEDPVRRDVILGRVLFFRGDYEASLAHLDPALERWPDNPGVRYIAGRAHQALGNHERAIEEYRTAMRANLSATDSALAAGYLALALGDPAEALQYVMYHVRGRPYRNAEPYVIGARAAALSGNTKAAGELLDHLAAQEGGLPAAVAERARLEGEANPEVAIANVETAELDLTAAENEVVLEIQTELLIEADRPDEALALADGAVAARPGEVVPLALRARALEAQGRPEEARAAADAALEADPES